MQAVSQCADREPAARTKMGDEQIWVLADRERLLMALYHAIRNAQDATARDGDVVIDVGADDRVCTIVVWDTGEGMDAAFIRDRLFKPFDSTKGTQGMGIGAYQIRETLRAIGGEMQVESTPGSGTSIILKIALATAEKV